MLCESRMFRIFDRAASFLLTATPSSQSRHTQSAPRLGILAIFLSSFPGTYISARRGLYATCDMSRLLARTLATLGRNTRGVNIVVCKSWID